MAGNSIAVLSGFHSMLSYSQVVALDAQNRPHLNLLLTWLSSYSRMGPASVSRYLFARSRYLIRMSGNGDRHECGKRVIDPAAIRNVAGSQTPTYELAS